MEHKICRCLEGRPKLPKNYYVFIKFSCKALGVRVLLQPFLLRKNLLIEQKVTAYDSQYS